MIEAWEKGVGFGRWRWERRIAVWLCPGEVGGAGRGLSGL
jgi:hypothetical protein